MPTGVLAGRVEVGPSCCQTVAMRPTRLITTAVSIALLASACSSSDTAAPAATDAPAPAATEASTTDADTSTAATATSTDASSENSEQAESTEAPAPASGAFTQPGEACDGDPAKPATIADGPAPAIEVRAESMDLPLPDLPVRRLNCGGGWVNLKNELPSDKPVLFWIWGAT